jgi:uncharacterized membrane protein
MRSAQLQRSLITQFTLAFFVYCLIVLRTSGGSGGIDKFVPSLALSLVLIMVSCGITGVNPCGP